MGISSSDNVRQLGTWHSADTEIKSRLVYRGTWWNTFLNYYDLTKIVKVFGFGSGDR